MVDLNRPLAAVVSQDGSGANSVAGNRVGGGGIAPINADLPFSFRPNGSTHDQASRLASAYVCAYGPAPEEGERISEGLRRRLADIESGRVKAIVYPSADEYIKHLDALLDG